jgi:hypothetical protein
MATPKQLDLFPELLPGAHAMSDHADLIRRLRWTNTPVTREAADVIEQLTAATGLPAMPPAAAPKAPRGPRVPRKGRGPAT